MNSHKALRKRKKWHKTAIFLAGSPVLLCAGRNLADRLGDRLQVGVSFWLALFTASLNLFEVLI